MINRSQLKIVGLYLLKLLGTGGFLYWAFNQVGDKQALADSFQTAMKSPGWVVAGIAVGAVSILAAALRWHVLLKAQSLDVTFPYVTRLILIAAMFNIVSVGGAGGNAARMIAVMRRNPGRKLVVTLTVMMDHIVGFVSTGVVFLFFAWGCGEVSGLEDGPVKRTLVGATVFELCGILMIILMFVMCSGRMIEGFWKKIPFIARRKRMMDFAQCLNLYRKHWRGTLVSLGASIVLSVSFFLAFYVGLRAIGEVIDVSTLLTVMPLVDVVSAMPISVSGLGVREKTFEYLVGEMTSIGPGAAVSASLIGFLFHVFWGLIGGVVLVCKRSRASEDVGGEVVEGREEL